VIVGFSGPSGSGKTTLVRELKKRLEEEEVSVGVVEEVARKVFVKYSERYGFESLNELRKSDVLMDFQLEIFKTQVSLEDELEEKYDVVLCDRTIYDNLFFTIPAIYSDKRGLLDEYIEAFLERDRQRKYTLIFFCHPISGNVDDGFRTPELSYRKFQGELIRRMIPYDIRTDSRFVYLPELSVEERVSICYEHVMFYLLRR